MCWRGYGCAVLDELVFRSLYDQRPLAMKETGGDQRWSFIPLWDGKPETFSHFIHEVKWSISSTKKDERGLMCAKIIRKALQAGPPTLVQLMYKLEPENFRTEEDIQKLIRYLEQSPLNRQALPDAGNKIGGYYRRLRRHQGESIPAFLVREDKVHSEMLQALQRLLRDKEMAFTDYEVTMEELRVFCGFKPGQSMFYGDDGLDEETSSRAQSETAQAQEDGNPFDESPRTASRRSSKSAKQEGPTEQLRGRDLLQRLMEKGLIPLSALDLVRGWMLLEMATNSEEERRLIRAATQNKLAYKDIKSALQTMFEERHHRIGPPHRDIQRKGKGFSHHHKGFFQSSWGADEPAEGSFADYGQVQDGYYGDSGMTDVSGAWTTSWDEDAWYHGPAEDQWESQPDESVPDDDTELYAQLVKEQEEAEKSYNELQALMSENERNLAEARRAVAEAARDRGWNSPPQQRQAKMTSTYPTKGMKGGKSGGHATKAKMNYTEDASWIKGQKSYGKAFHNKGKHHKGFSKGKDLSFIGGYDFWPMVDGDDLYGLAGGGDDLASSESIVDTGATASAGGQEAVQKLCTAILQALPESQAEVYTEDRPWFRYGNGRWGQALFRLEIRYHNLVLSFYSLPSPGVPVLTGMRELSTLNAILNCVNGRSIINGRPTTLRMTRKRHMVLNYLGDVFVQDSTTPNVRQPAQPRFKINHGANNSRSSGLDGMRHAQQFSEAWDLFGFSSWHSALDDNAMESVYVGSSLDFPPGSRDQWSAHMGISRRDMEFLMCPLADTAQEFPAQPVPKGIKHVHFNDGRCEGADENPHERSGARDHGGEPRPRSGIIKGQSSSTQAREEQNSGLRSGAPSGPRHARPSDGADGLAMPRRAHGEDLQQPVRKMGRVHPMRSTPELRASRERPRNYGQDGPPTACDRGLGTSEERGHPRGGLHQQNGEGHDHSGGQGVSAQGQGPAEQTCRDDQASPESGRGGSEQGRLGEGGRLHQSGCEASRGSQGQPVDSVGESHDGSVPSHDMHYEDHDMHDEPIAGEETCIRSMRPAEIQYLKDAAKEFEMGSIMTALQDFDRTQCTVWEVCCRLTSSLTEECNARGMTSLRKTLENGYNLEKAAILARLKTESHSEKPYRAWFSLKCTEWSSIQNLNRKTDAQAELLRKKRQKARKMAKHALELIMYMHHHIPGFKFYWEWPRTAHDGWTLDVMKEFMSNMRQKQVRLNFTEIHGCMYDMKSPEGELLNKPWLIMSNDDYFHYRCQRKCDGSHQHRPGGIVGIGSQAVESTGFYPKAMVKDVVKAWRAQDETERRKHYSNHILVEIYGMEMLVKELKSEVQPNDPATVSQATLERAKSMLHRLHRAAGHPSNRALSRLCKDRGLPDWMVRMAMELKCQACLETQTGEQKILPYSLGAKPSPWQVVGADVMELVFPAHRCKARFLVMTDLVTRLTSVKMTWKGSVGESGTDSGRKLTEAFVDGWLMHRPKPAWVLVDPQTSLASGDFAEFMALAGIGVSVTPGEAHWQAGSVESIIRVIKGTARKLRSEHPELDPETCLGLAVNSHNMQYKTKGFSPAQWAYGFNPNEDDSSLNPVDFNAHQHHVPYKFWTMHRLRQVAEDVWRKAQAAEAWTRLSNASSRNPRIFHVGQWVCIWRTAIWRTRKKSMNPEPRYVGPGRVALVEPAIQAENTSAVYWVVMGTQVWRCAPEQMRLASEQEITLEEIKFGQRSETPITEILKRTSKVVDVLREGAYPRGSDDLPETPGPQGIGPGDPVGFRAQTSSQWTEDLKRARHHWRGDRKRAVETTARGRQAQEKWRWKQLISVNENRRREGMPPIVDLPHVPSESEDGLQTTQYFSLEAQDLPVTEETYGEILGKIEELENLASAVRAREQLREEIRSAQRQEAMSMQLFTEACENREEVLEVSIDLEDWPSLLASGGALFVKQQMASAKGAEVNWRTLTPEDQNRMREAMAREVSEVVKANVLKSVQEKMNSGEVQLRSIPMRWLLTWKPLDAFTDPAKEQQPGVIRSDGMAKAKARIVLIGYKHPDLAKRDPRTGQSLLQTSSPTLSRLGRNLLLQAGALDGHLLESADAKSAFLQADYSIGDRKLYTAAVDEISNALNVPYGTALEIIGVIYGLTNAPRTFWLDADDKLRRLGAEEHGVDKCLWLFRNKAGQICGRVGAHVDDFLILGNHKDPCWIRFREKIKQMYSWSPWQCGRFVFAGVLLQQLQDYTILMGQEQFCNDLRPVVIENERQRPKDDKLSPKELSQARGLIMKAQWRALQTAPQYCCRIGLASSSLKENTLSVLKEANAIVKELKKTSKDGLIFHSFNGENLDWQQVIFLHFSDAARANRSDGSDTGGFVTGVASPKILEGHEARVSMVDYKSWKLERPVKGSNGSEAQALYETEDKGWKARLFWTLLYGERLLRGNADKLTSCVESLLIMDSRGCFDSLSNSDSPLLGMNNAKTGVELRSVQYGIREGSRCYPTWAPSDMNIADALTKVSYEAFKVWSLWQSRKTWVVRFNSEFVSARKQQKLRQQQGKPKHVLMDPHFEESLDWPESRHN